MGKPLPEHVTRAEAAKVLRLSVRQVDRLAEAGKLKKVPLSANRRGFDRDAFDRYLASLGSGEGYVSRLECLAVELPADCPFDCNKAAERLDEILATALPGCLIRVDGGHIQIAWNAALGYSADLILEAMKR